MAVNTRTEYALRVLIELSDSGVLSAQKICDAQKLPKKYIEHLLSLLKSAGIVVSSAGSLGGYTLSKDPAQISFLDILNAVEDSSFDTSCDSDSARHCLGEGCTLTHFFLALNTKLQGIFGSYSLADVLKVWKEGLGT